MRIGILGMGVVGKALRSFYVQKHEVFTYDIATDDDDKLESLNKSAEVVFIAVGTPSAPDGSLDCSAVYDAVSKLSGSKTVILKSTVMPGTTDELQVKYPDHTFWFVPEFLSEATAAEDYANPRKPHVVGCVGDPTEQYDFAKNNIRPLLPIWREHAPFPMSQSVVESPNQASLIPARQAELLKLATNTFYALKVTYANMLYDIGMEQYTLNVLGADNWIGGEHFEIDHKNYRGYGGNCLSKDLAGLFEYARGALPIGSYDLPGICRIIGLMDTYNVLLRTA